ncbi:MAG: hypothetical protein GC178_05115 [Flavobacteriales bacterium]|nr:hypothetical protein [Flavobacteriales bacterium]
MDKLKKFLPHVLVTLGLLIVALAYMHPVILEKKELIQSDIVNFLGMSKEIVDFREETGEEPLWTNSMFGGMPAYQISTLYPNNWSKKIIHFINHSIPQPANYLFLMLAGAYFMFLMMGVNWRYALAGSIAYGLASYTVIILEAGHNSKAHAMAYMAPVIGSILLTYRGRYLLGSALLALFLSLQIATNHLQITYYLLLTILVLGAVKLVDAIKNNQLPNFAKATGLMVVAAIIAVGPNFGSLWTTADYGKETMRGKSELTAKKESSGLEKDYAMRWSYGVGETFTLMIPDFMGGSSMQSFLMDENSATYQAFVSHRPTTQQEANELGRLQQQTTAYWGAQPFTSGPVYLGAIICFLALLGMLVVKTSDRWWLFIAFVLSIMLSWGTNFAWFSDLFFNYFPGYNKFRAVSMTLVIAQLVLPILAVLGLKSFFEMTDKNERQKSLMIAAGVSGGICLLLWLAPSMFLDFMSNTDAALIGTKYDWLLDALQEDRTALLKSDALRSLVLILLAAALLFVYHLNKLKAGVAGILISVLVLVDLWNVDQRYLSEDDFVRKSQAKNVIAPTDADKQILADKDPNFRVINLATNTFNDSKTSYFHKSIGGYHGAKLERYQELIDSCISNTNLAVLNMLNTKYFITPDRATGKPSVRRNPLALGNAWFVSDVALVDNADQELSYLNRNDFNPEEVAVIDKRFESELSGFQPTVDSTASIYFLEYQPNYLKYETEAAKDQLAVFSEIYFANGWNAYVDGELKPHWRADYVLRSMIVPAGKHVVEFKFEPRIYYTGEKISLAGSILMVLFVIGGVVLDARSKKD